MIMENCPKLPIVNLLAMLFYSGHHNILRLQPYTCIYLLKQGIISLNTVMRFILGFKNIHHIFEIVILMIACLNLTVYNVFFFMT